MKRLKRRKVGQPIWQCFLKSLPVETTRLFVYAAAAAFYLKRSPQPFGNQKTYFTVHGVHMFFAFKMLERKKQRKPALHALQKPADSAIHCCSIVNCTVRGFFFFFSVLIVLIFLKKKKLVQRIKFIRDVNNIFFLKNQYRVN